MKHLFLLFMAGTFLNVSVTGQTVESRLNDIKNSAGLIEQAIDDTDAARTSFAKLVAMNMATAADASVFLSTVQTAQETVEEQQDEIQFFASNAQSIDPDFDTEYFISRAAEIEGLEDAVNNLSQAAVNAFLGGDKGETLKLLGQLNGVIAQQRALNNQIIHRACQLLK